MSFIVFENCQMFSCILYCTQIKIFLLTLGKESAIFVHKKDQTPKNYFRVRMISTLITICIKPTFSPPKILNHTAFNNGLNLNFSRKWA